MKSAVALLERDGFLAGLNMQEVADHAGVNRGLIHHYFGSRQALLRAALERGRRDTADEAERRRPLHPYDKGTKQFNDYVRNPMYTRLVALLAVDGDEAFEPFFAPEDRLADFERERAEGVFAADVDLVALMTAWDATLLGYALTREAASRQLGVPVAELDRRVLRLLRREIEPLRGSADGDPGDQVTTSGK